MILSLTAALVIYLPLLFLIVAVGTPGQSVSDAAAADPEILIAVAARNFLGPTGYWLVVVAGLLSMLSALQANLLAASRFARTMAGDRTLPRRFDRLAPGTGTPIPAIQLTAATVAIVLVAVPNVAAAGAMASLIFLASFALAHGIAYLARRRATTASPFQTPAFPLVPVVGGVSCIALALFQSVAVPSAGAMAALWLGIGAVLYMTQLAPRSLGRGRRRRGPRPAAAATSRPQPVGPGADRQPGERRDPGDDGQRARPALGRPRPPAVGGPPARGRGPAGSCHNNWWTRSRSSAVRFRPPSRPISDRRP